MEGKIESGISDGYDHIFCVIDMDTKDEEPERAQYARLKKKYAKPVNKPKKGIYCEVNFFETHRCTELFFLYYFRYTSHIYHNQQELLSDLGRQCEYEKSVTFFKKSNGLHAYFEKKGGNLETAIRNAEYSIDTKLADNRDYTYSELGKMIERLRELM